MKTRVSLKYFATGCRRKRNHNKDKPRTIVFKLHSYEDKERIMRNVYQLKNTGYYINKDFSKATLNVRAELWVMMILDACTPPRASGVCSYPV